MPEPDLTSTRETDAADLTTPGAEEGGADRSFYKVTILLMLGVFIYLLVDSVSPLVFGAGLAVLLLFSRRGARFETGVGLVFTLLLISFVFSSVAGLLWPFVVSFILAYLLAPLVGVFARYVPRTLAIAVIAFLVLGLMSLVGVALVPRLIDEVRDFVGRLPTYAAYLRDLYQELILLLRRYNYSGYAGELQQRFLSKLPELGQIFADQTTAILRGLTSGIAATLNLLMIPFVTFYVLKDYDRIREIVNNSLPKRHRVSAVGVLTQVDNVLGQYIRGQMIVSTFIAAMTFTGLALSGVRYSLVLGLTAGALNLIPYVGLSVSLGVALLVAVMDANALTQCLKVVAVFVVVQGVEGNFLSPRVVGQKVGLHPAWVMFALVIAANFWGFVGMIVAIPVAAVINILVTILLQRYYGSSYYGGTAAD